jgi:hypothetical protein
MKYHGYFWWGKVFPLVGAAKRVSDAPPSAEVRSDARLRQAQRTPATLP